MVATQAEAHEEIQTSMGRPRWNSDVFGTQQWDHPTHISIHESHFQYSTTWASIM